MIKAYYIQLQLLKNTVICTVFLFFGRKKKLKILREVKQYGTKSTAIFYETNQHIKRQGCVVKLYTVLELSADISVLWD